MGHDDPPACPARLIQDIADYSVLKLTEAARRLLKGEIELQLAKPRIRESARKTKRLKSDVHEPYDEQLFGGLRRLRKSLADAEDKPPYIVFGDATLVQMAREKRLDDDALPAIAGFEGHKLQKYGSAFLDAIAEYRVAQSGS